MVLSIRRSDDVGKDVSRLVKQELPGIANTEDGKRFQPTDVKPFVEDNVRNLKSSF